MKIKYYQQSILDMQTLSYKIDALILCKMFRLLFLLFHTDHHVIPFNGAENDRNAVKFWLLNERF